MDGALGALELQECLGYMLAEGVDISKIQAVSNEGGFLRKTTALSKSIIASILRRDIGDCVRNRGQSNHKISELLVLC